MALKNIHSWHDYQTGSTFLSYPVHVFLAYDLRKHNHVQTLEAKRKVFSLPDEHHPKAMFLKLLRVLMFSDVSALDIP